MTPDDPRHGSNAGYCAGCRCARCTAAATRYAKQLRLDGYQGRPRTVSSLGTFRRVEALMALGWSQRAIAAAAGMEQTNLSKMLRTRRPVVFRSTADRIAQVYDAWHMAPPRGDLAHLNLVRNLARERGYVPPLGWDDIDNDLEPPAGEPVDVDEVVIHRVLHGERLAATQEEKAEVVRLWLASGRPLKQLEQQTGWNGKREKDRAFAAEGAA